MSIALVFATVAGALAFALWIAAELFSPSPRWWIPCAALVALAGGVSGSFIARAETPFGAGIGVVPTWWDRTGARRRSASTSGS